MTKITRTQYKKARRLLRDNGKYALRWMDADTRATMELVINASDERDNLADAHRANLQGLDRDQPGKVGFFDSSDTYRTKRDGQRGRF